MTEVLHEDGQEPDGHCLEKRVYYKAISGVMLVTFDQVQPNKSRY